MPASYKRHIQGVNNPFATTMAGGGRTVPCPPLDDRARDATLLMSEMLRMPPPSTTIGLWAPAKLPARKTQPVATDEYGGVIVSAVCANLNPQKP
jgi:hypothetical protein